MADTLVIGGTTYTGVEGIKATDSNDNTQTFIRPTGTKSISITENGTTTEDVAAYANAEITVNVQGGGGWTTEGIATNTEPNGVVTLKNLNQTYSVGSYAFAYKPITGLVIDMNNLSSDFRMGLNVFSNSNLASVAVINNSYDSGIIISSAFQSTPIESFDLPDTKINFAGYTGAFMDCKKLTRINLPRAYGGMMAPCQRCYLLSFADMGEANTLNSNGFQNCYVLQTLILRSKTVVTIPNVGVFANTPMSGYNGLTGTLYVPSDLVEDYKAATNWSTLYSGGTMQILAIEGSIYE